ncbi:hypothetical protein [Azospirillum canadense]|uniref:hypothetical protein n=1 Tax=Azospirillum canadense TaxID=403962 RepID=UPI002227257A|nr:hypothetical protein [Azospirillum canadense]MCW2238227.1 hypothetical protein [Azospirillum canadense]
MNTSPVVGFNQRIKLEWMAATARMVTSGSPYSEIVGGLRELLKDELSVGGDPERGNREKAITILKRIWLTVDEQNIQLRDDGLALLVRLPNHLHVAVHWSMAMAAYPFLGEVAQVVGRLLQLQDEVAATQVQRRLRERFGERETVARAARRVLRTFIDWGVLQESGVKGIYHPVPRVSLKDDILLSWMAEAFIRCFDNQMRSVEEIRRALAFFPFDTTPLDTTALPSNARLEVFRQGVGEVLVRISKREAIDH